MYMQQKDRVMSDIQWIFNIWLNILVYIIIPNQINRNIQKCF